MQFHITPHTKVMDLLELYPDVEDFLISLVPPFSNLKNPVLRNTIGRLATLEQAAKVGEVSLPFLINAINEKLGLLPDSLLDSNKDKTLAFIIDESKIMQVLDADEMINSGAKPVAIVLGTLNKLDGDDILQLNCSFHPAPLIDKAIEAGYSAQEVKNPDMSLSIYFRKR